MTPKIVPCVSQQMLAFDEVWPADLPALRPLRLNLRRSCGVISVASGIGSGDNNDDSGNSDTERGPVFLMPMHRKGKGIEGRYDMILCNGIVSLMKTKARRKRGVVDAEVTLLVTLNVFQRGAG